MPGTYAKYAALSGGGSAPDNGITNLTGDVTADGPGSVPATVNSAADGTVVFANAEVQATTFTLPGYKIMTHGGVLSVYMNSGVTEAMDFANNDGNIVSRIPHAFLDRIDIQTAGQASLPVIRFNGNTATFETGFYQPGQDQIGISIGGIMTTMFSSSGLSLSGPVSTPASGVGTLTNLPAGASGDPSVYLQITVGGTTYVFPGWAI